MISFRSSVCLELRKRLDTRGAQLGYLFFFLLMVASGWAGVAALPSEGSFDAGELIVVVGLPCAFDTAVVGVVMGVGEGRAGSERDGVLVGLSRGSTYAARGTACAVVVSVSVVVAIMIAFCAILVASAIDKHPVPEGSGLPLAQVIALSCSSGVLGFGVGAATRSLALSLLGVVLAISVVDTALSFCGPWSVYIRFSSLQSGLTGEAAGAPAVSAGVIWLLLPVLLGWLRARRADLSW